MKAFQLKVVIKDSKPPIWRRVIVPAGITFSQLSMILNEAMGWSGEHLFEFEFYHLQLHIFEGADEEPAFGMYDSLEASTTYIREYLEENDWFTYIYDMGYDWKHRVTVEKVLTDYEKNYPQVIKFKGDCPPEDCGGIYGFYSMLSAAADESDPEYEDAKEWLKSQIPYSMEDVNARLEKSYFYIWGKGEKRTQVEIESAMYSGTLGLHATKRDKNKKDQIVRSPFHQTQDAMRQFSAMLTEMQKRGQSLQELREPEISLKEIMSDYEKEDILDIAEGKGIRGVSGYNKKKLIDAVITYMMRPEIAESYFSCLTDAEIRAFEECANAAGTYYPEDDDRFMKLGMAGYIGITSDGQIRIPKETKKVYQQIIGPDFDKKRRKMGYFCTCMEIANILYGITPLEVLAKLTQTNPKSAMNEKEVEEAFGRIPPDIREYILEDGKIYARTLWPDDHGLLKAQGNKPFYIPSEEEIRQLEELGVITDMEKLESLQRELIRRFRVSEEEAGIASGIIAVCFTGGGGLDDALEVLEEFDIVVNGAKQMKQLADRLQALRNHTRILTNRGYTPLEMIELERNAVPNTVSGTDSGNKVISLAEARKNKIYPNDPCPCGSGKKYKNCCKRKNDEKK